MRLRDYLLTITAGTVFAFAALLHIVFRVDPVNSSIATPLFLITLSLSLLGLFTVGLTLIRHIFEDGWTTKMLLGVSIRQAAILALVISSAAYLSMVGALTIPSTVVILIVLGCAEYFVLSKMKL
jgi:hypothetical protein